MIRNLLTILTGIFLIATTGAVWSLTAASSLATSAHWEMVTLLGSAAALSFLGAPWALCFLWAYTRPRGRHGAPVQRSRSRYFKIKEG